ncbi:MAG: sigma-70 family RNA polymerase sigma factor [Dehalococcoidia bacterium]|nr:sigma-70 family RNA polymerase sigma factor [Dehalococcoidia bacterium]MDZ4245566.1 sigma-70 family RNA polymerase sigma factor [Dehalococcoidia bacterium]
MVTQIEENDLIKRCQQGEINCFNRLVENYQVPVFNLALRMMGDVHSAEDAAQETFISAWKGIESFQLVNFKSWLMRICANTCRDYLRSSKRSPKVSLEDNFAALSEAVTPSHDNPEVLAERKMVEEEIQKGLNTLHPDQKLAVVLCDLQEMNYDEIAGIMGTSIGTVRSRISRGRQHLRDYLLKQGELFGNQIRLIE